jgi:hypothetical protein
VARELERRVAGLLGDILEAEILPTPEWLVRPGEDECGSQWLLVQSIYKDLTGLDLPPVMRRVERRTVDAVLQQEGKPPRIVEIDEKQHFNRYRARTLRRYLDEVPVAFPAREWIERSERKTNLEGGGFGAPKPPLFPGEGGRHRQRAFRDALSDILPPEHGWLPTLRIGYFEVTGWIAASDAPERMEQLLKGRGVTRQPDTARGRS